VLGRHRRQLADRWAEPAGTFPRPRPVEYTTCLRPGKRRRNLDFVGGLGGGFVFCRSCTPCMTRREHSDPLACGKLTFYAERMSDYRRYFVPGGTYFHTLVIRNRAPLFANEKARRLLGSVIRECLQRRPLTVVAFVLLPDHLHCLWTLPSGDSDYSNRWRWIKREFTRGWLGDRKKEQRRSKSSKRQRGVWQRRFWEHTIRDETDLENHFDYIHYNPVKHGHVERVRDWPWSTFHRHVRAGHYSPNWGAEAPRSTGDCNFGE
jgi:putative transposase